MIASVVTYSQQSFDLYGNLHGSGAGKFRLNSFESNAANVNTTKDWELSFIYGGIVTSGAEFANDIFLVSLAKRINEHYFYFRYTPGLKQEFIASTISKITSGDSSKTDILNTSISYEERFGLGYSLDITPELTAGMSFRFFHQNFQEDNIEFVYGDSTTNTYTINSNKNFWRGDLGFAYRPYPNLALGIYTANLILLNENGRFEDNNNLELRTNKQIIGSINYSFAEDLSANFVYESNSSLSTGIVYSYNLSGGKLNGSVTVHHDKYQNPFISSVMPSVSFSSRLFNISLVGVKYLSDRTGVKPISELAANGIHNILNNPYSLDKIFLNVNFALSFKSDKLVALEDVKITKDIYPTLSDEYTDFPFATGTVINTTDEPVNVKPSSYISSVNHEIIFSPIVTVQPGDTIQVPFYTIIDPSKSHISNRQIDQATFYLTTVNKEPDAELSKPILINDSNSWDGKVSSLRYFARQDYQYTTSLAKEILSGYKTELDSTHEILLDYRKTAILFNAFVQSMVYVSDPRSSVEYVQFPKETIDRKGGDCDDLSVGFSALLESAGVQTAFVDYKEKDGLSHVNLLVNTGLAPNEAALITNNDKKYYLRTNARGIDEIWLPVEITSLTDFRTAWTIGAEKFNKEAIEELGLARGNVVIVDNY